MAFALLRAPHLRPARLLPTPGPLARQCLDVVRDLAPPPRPFLEAVEASVPLPLKQLVAEAPLNHKFRQAISEGEFDDFEGRLIRLEIEGGGPGITLGFWQRRLRVVNGPGETTIRGSCGAFRALASKELDPDQLFFQRRLMIEGDTELGLAIKNLLDSLA
ncbi:Predicted lipid carrier protein YhbT, contains SCP2 domain [Marinobacter daqiaonensis]|uniref:Predicted lipid carrier protein YhbT, contains SCP2 domain n=1 Tax=Marinobacter daqiaonensis TaxID=650891 RepID=A0A1I6HPN9_9GAMM|nr:SCP2 sterol-binding domain-containing protein [Marinobacter daqiaonensis]SFR56422.1 Predicted lipid carrier protein YhbT, contains SCP2 domain [Marinobacter daqiaonensis]